MIPSHIKCNELNHLLQEDIQCVFLLTKLCAYHSNTFVTIVIQDHVRDIICARVSKTLCIFVTVYRMIIENCVSLIDMIYGRHLLNILLGIYKIVYQDLK